MAEGEPKAASDELEGAGERAAPASPSPEEAAPGTTVKLEFGGGLELLFDGTKEATKVVAAPAGGTAVSMEHLIHWVAANMLQERPELFLSGNTVRPGILVLINDVDWELEGETEYEVQEGDTVAFISTLHGG